MKLLVDIPGISSIMFVQLIPICIYMHNVMPAPQKANRMSMVYLCPLTQSFFGLSWLIFFSLWYYLVYCDVLPLSVCSVCVATICLFCLCCHYLSVLSVLPLSVCSVCVATICLFCLCCHYLSVLSVRWPTRKICLHWKDYWKVIKLSI